MRRLRISPKAVLELYEGADAKVWQMLLGDALHIGGIQASRALAGKLEIPKGARVLDVGAGLCASARMLAKEYGCQVTGVDISAQMRRQATTLNQQAGLAQRIGIVDADAGKLPFPDESFTVVWCEDVYYHLGDKQGALGEAWRVLKPGGKLVLTDWVETQLGLAGREFVRVGSFLAAPYLETLRGYKKHLRELGAGPDLSEEAVHKTTKALMSLMVELHTDVGEKIASRFGQELYDTYDKGLSCLVEAAQSEHLARARIVASKS